jgi:hypothetical protein
MSDTIDRLPFDLQARLESHPFFADIPVLIAEEGDLELELQRKQAVLTEKGGKLGVAVVVLQLLADDPYANPVLGPMLLRPAFQVVENKELNRGPSGTGKTARRIAKEIRNVIKPFGVLGFTTDFVPDKPCIEPVDVPKDLRLSVYQVNFTTYEICPSMDVVSAPYAERFAAETPQIQLLCPTEGAQIWYSLDESFPGPGRVGSQLYAAPIEIPADGLVISACAYKEGMVASQLYISVVSFTAV